MNRNELLSRIERNRARMGEAVAAIRADARLSDAGRKEELTKAYREAMAAHKALSRQLSEATEAERQTLTARAFSANGRGLTPSPAQEQNFRDAMRTAEEAKSLPGLLRRAALTGDGTLVRAVAAVAAGRGEWGTLAAAGEHDRDVAALVAFEGEAGTLRNATAKFGERVRTTAPSRPSEVDANAASDLA